jgi:hypothetical protein
MNEARTVQRGAVVAAVLALSFIQPGRGPRTSRPPRVATATAGAKVERATFDRLPLRFERNDGQFDPRVRYVGRARDAALFLTDDAVTLVLEQPRRPPASAALRAARLGSDAPEPRSLARR